MMISLARDLPCGSFRNRSVFWHTALLAAVVSFSSQVHGAFNVTGQNPVEGTTEAADVVFEIHLDASAPEPMEFNYATVSGSAVEDVDYQARRGRLTIAAGQTTAEVRVPVIPDAEMEEDEEFGLMVWPAGGALNPTLHALPEAEAALAPGYQWSSVEGRAPGGFALEGWSSSGAPNRMVALTRGTPWAVEAEFALPPGGSSIGHAGDLAHDWFVTADRVFPGGALGGNARIHLWQRDRLTPGVWSELSPTVLRGTDGSGVRTAIEGNWLVVGVRGQSTPTYTVRLFELSAAAAPREAGRIVLPSPAGVTALSDRRLLVMRSSGMLLYEALDDRRTDWRVVLDRPGVSPPVQLDGDRLLGVAGGMFRTWERNAGGPDNWGEVAAGPATADLSRARPVLRGSVLLIGDKGPYDGNSAPGEVRVFTRDGAAGGWAAAGTFTAPLPAVRDFFGEDVALAGLDVAVVAGSGRPSWAGSFPGARAVLRNDDTPSLRVLPSVALEPKQQGNSAFVQAVLSRTATAPVTLAWTTSAGSATPGQDYVESTGSAVIPAGEWQTALRIPMLPDSVPEEDETLVVTITEATGATLAGAAADLRLRDSFAAVAAVSVAVQDGHEGSLPGVATVTVHAAGPTPAVPWSTGRIVRSDGVTSGYAIPGTDFTPVTGIVSAGAGLAAHQANIAAAGDTLSEGHEQFNVLTHLPAGAVGATYAPRLLIPMEQAPTFATDGRWAAIVDAKRNGGVVLRGDIVLYRREAVSAGGWVEHTRLRASQFGGSIWSAGSLHLEDGSLFFRDSTTAEAFLFSADSGGPGQWGLVQRMPIAPEVLATAFDGHTLLWCDPGSVPGERPAVLEAREKGADGRWTQYDALDASNLVPFGFTQGVSIAVDGSVAAIASMTTAGYTLLRIFEREAGTAVKWRVAASHILTGVESTGARRVCVHRDAVAVAAAGSQPPGILVFRRAPDGAAWPLEQVLPASGLSYMDRGVLLAGQEVWTSSAGGAAPWRKSAVLPADWTPGSFHDGVLAAVSGLNVLIAEPGNTGTIVDAQTLSVSVSTGGFPVSEALETTVPLRPSLQMSRAAGIPISIPWRTEDITATAGRDYLAAGGVATIPPGHTSVLLLTGILPDTLLEEDETFRIVCGPPSFGVQAEVSSIVTIRDRDIPFSLPAGPIPLPEPAVGQAEHFIPVPLTYPVAADTVFPCTVHTTFIGTTPFAGPEDVAGGSFDVTVPAGSSVLPIRVTLFADALTEPRETVTISVGTPAGFTQPAGSFLLVQILDAVHPGLSAPIFSVAENGALMRAAPGVLTGNTGGYQRVRLTHGPAHGTLDLQADGSFSYTPAPGFTGTDRFAFQAIESTTDIIAPGAVTTWRWRHPLNGTDPGTTVAGFQANWKLPGFNDTTWTTGSGLMGYGSIGPAPSLPLTTNIGTPPGGQRYTAYFRHAFNAPEAAAVLSIEFIGDDAAIFYVNGTEGGRTAPPPSTAFFTAPDTYTLLCENALSDPDEATLQYISLPVALSAGANLLAVSLHNQSANSSDLAFRLHSLRAGAWSAPVAVTLTVTDNFLPPSPAADVFTFPSFAPAADSRFIGGGGLYVNDQLLADDGSQRDPVLEVATGGSPAGPVTVDPATGHFRMTLPGGFAGRTEFTYRLRDKDGWSESVPVTVHMQPSSLFEVWQHEQFGPQPNASAAFAADPDLDGHANLLEFFAGRSPLTPDFRPLLQAAVLPGGVELNLETLFSTDNEEAVLSIQSSAEPHLPESWIVEASFGTRSNAPLLVRPGVTSTATLVPATVLYQRRVQTAFHPGVRFYRLHAAPGAAWWRIP
jgi:hypothetical protein